MQRLTVLAALTFLLTSAFAPERARAQVDAVSVVRLEASPPSVVVMTGEEVPFEVRALDARGRVVADAQVRTVAPRAAAVVRGGTVRGRTMGEYEIVATLLTPPGYEGTPPSLRVPLTVLAPEVATVEVTAERGRLYQGTTLRHTATARHADGSARPGPVVSWSSSDPSVATVDRFGYVTATGTGAVTIRADVEGTAGTAAYDVAPFPAVSLDITGLADEVRTGDVQHLTAVARDAAGELVADVPVTWTHTAVPDAEMVAPSAPGQIARGRFVADVPGVYTIMANAGPLAARATLQAVGRDAVRELTLVGAGSTATVRTTDFWVFEGLDGRDYALTGAKMSDGYAYAWDVTDPGNIFKTDSLQVDARSVNDVKVSPDARYATLTREGASNRRNGVVFLDLADPAHPVIASEVVEGLTGGVHNAFPGDDYAYVLAAGDKYVIIDVADIHNPRVVGEYNHPDSRLHDVWVLDGIAYSAEWEKGMVAVDVGNGRWGGTPENPVLISELAVPTGTTHAIFPYRSQSTDRFYVFVGDENMQRRGLANAGPRGGGSYQLPYDPETGMNGIPLATQGYIQVIDFTDPDNPEMVARYEVSEYGTHNIWVEDDILYQAYYEGGLRVVDVSGELMGNLYTQGREIAVHKSTDVNGWVPNSTMVWSAMPFKGHVFFSDTNSGLWSVKVEPPERPVS